jgi:hypothetical protein
MDRLAEEAEKVFVRPVQQIKAAVMIDPVRLAIVVVDAVLPDIAGGSLETSVVRGERVEIPDSGD